MNLGLDIKDLDRLFWGKFEKIFDEMQSNKDKEIKQLIFDGYSRLEASLQVELLNRMAASASTISSLISANNLRIQAQLEAKGIEF